MKNPFFFLDICLIKRKDVKIRFERQNPGLCVCVSVCKISQSILIT